MRDKLKLHCNVISGYAFSSSDWKNDGIPVIKIGNISNGEGITENKSLECVDEAFLDKLDSKYHISNGDILISLTGSHVNLPNSMVGRCCRNITDKIYLLNQRAGKILSFDNTDHNYLYYLLSTKAIKYEIVNRAYGGANQVNVSPKDILDIMWEFPDLEAQRKISGVLLKYDDLIENNLARISLLEKMASELYKEWFVRFRFPGHEAAKFVDGVPEGWTYGVLSDIMIVGAGKTRPESGNRYPVYGGNGILDYADDYNDENSIIIGRVGAYCGSVYYEPSKCWVSDNALYAKSKFNSPLYTYYLLRSLNLNSRHSGTGQPLITQGLLNKLKTIIAPISLMKEYDNIVSKLFLQQENLQRQNHNLTKQRDLLLPRLMSGKLSVEPLLADTA